MSWPSMCSCRERHRGAGEEGGQQEQEVKAGLHCCAESLLSRARTFSGMQCLGRRLPIHCGEYTLLHHHRTSCHPRAVLWLHNPCPLLSETLTPSHLLLSCPTHVSQLLQSSCLGHHIPGLELLLDGQQLLGNVGSLIRRRPEPLDKVLQVLLQQHLDQATHSCSCSCASCCCLPTQLGKRALHGGNAERSQMLVSQAALISLSLQWLREIALQTGRAKHRKPLQVSLKRLIWGEGYGNRISKKQGDARKDGPLWHSFSPPCNAIWGSLLQGCSIFLVSIYLSSPIIDRCKDGLGISSIGCSQVHSNVSSNSSLDLVGVQQYEGMDTTCFSGMYTDCKKGLKLSAFRGPHFVTLSSTLFPPTHTHDGPCPLQHHQEGQCKAGQEAVPSRAQHAQ